MAGMLAGLDSGSRIGNASALIMALRDLIVDLLRYPIR